MHQKKGNSLLVNIWKGQPNAIQVKFHKATINMKSIEKEIFKITTIKKKLNSHIDFICDQQLQMENGIKFKEDELLG